MQMMIMVNMKPTQRWHVGIVTVNILSIVVDSCYWFGVLLLFAKMNGLDSSITQ